MTQSCLVTKKKKKKKLVWTTNNTALGGYGLLCTDLGDGISCILSPNHNIDREKWCLSAVDKISFEVKKCVENAFSRHLETQIKISSFAAHHGGISGDTDLANSKETQSLRKNGCRQKCLHKSLISKDIQMYFSFKYTPDLIIWLLEMFYVHSSCISNMKNIKGNI